MKGEYRNRLLIISVVIFVVVLISLIRATINVKSLRKNFQEEKAQRWDLEEKATKLENERQMLLTELRALKTEVDKYLKEIDYLKKELLRQEEENSALESALEKKQSGT